MNLKLALPSNLAVYLKVLSRARTALVGLFLIAVFGYTAYIVDAATNIVPAAPATSSPKIVFDKAALAAIKDRTQVNDKTELGNLGKTDPFAR